MMGVSCNIIIPQTRGYLAPGSDVSGTIKYAIDKPTSFKRIVVSLKGHGQRIVVVTKGSGKNRRERKYYDHETYVHNDMIVQDKERTMCHDIGSYETNFHFRLPENIPPSLDYFRNYGRYKVTCTITYYVRIKFERTGTFQFDKRFKKELLVQSIVTPRLGANLNYSARKTLFQPFRRKESNVSIKASIPYSFLRPGQKVQVHCEMENNTNIDIKSFKSKLLEVYTFRGNNMFYDAVMEAAVRDTESKTSSIKRGESTSTTVEIDLPQNVSSLGNSKLVSRDYYVVLKLGLPMPYFNVYLKVPIEVGYIAQDFQQNVPDLMFEPPPSYWEVMNEYNEDDKKYGDD